MGKDLDPVCEVRLQLAVLSLEQTAEELSAMLGTTATKLWRTGESILGDSPARHKENGWALVVTGPEVNRDPDLAVRNLLDTLPSTAAFRSLPPSCEVQLSIGLTGHRARPGLYLSAETLARLSAIRASLDIDTYDLTGS